MFQNLGNAFLLGDTGIPLPVAGLLDSIVLDFTIRDLMFWYKLMNWSELGLAVTGFLAVKIACDRIEAWAVGLIKPHVKRWVAARCPRLVGRFPQLAMKA